MNNDILKWGALTAALVATASAEYELALAVGFNQWVAAAVPGALDLYTVRALRTGKEVLAAVAAMIGVNAASHLVTAGLVAVSVPLVVAVSAIAPLVLWRVHSLSTGHPGPEGPSEFDEVQPVEVTAPVTLERVDEQPPPPALEPRPLPEVVPAGTDLLPIVARPEPVEVTTAKPPTTPAGDGFPLSNLDTHKLAEVVTPRFYMLDHFKEQMVPDTAAQVTSAVPAATPRQVVTEVVALTPSELRRRATKLNRELVTSSGRQVTIDRLREEFNLSRREAAELRRQVVTSEPEVRS